MQRENNKKSNADDGQDEQIEMKNPLESNESKCNFCKESFKSEYVLQNHVKVAHEQSQIDSFEEVEENEQFENDPVDPVFVDEESSGNKPSNNDDDGFDFFELELDEFIIEKKLQHQTDKARKLFCRTLMEEVHILRDEKAKVDKHEATIESYIKKIEAFNKEREELQQKCHELEMQVKVLTEDKSIMSTEVENLQAQIISQDQVNWQNGHLRSKILKLEKFGKVCDNCNKAFSSSVFEDHDRKCEGSSSNSKA